MEDNKSDSNMKDDEGHLQGFGKIDREGRDKRRRWWNRKEMYKLWKKRKKR